MRFDIFPFKLTPENDWDITGLIDLIMEGDLYIVQAEDRIGRSVKLKSNFYLTNQPELFEDPSKVTVDGEWRPL
jgi:hypothetical protein